MKSKYNKLSEYEKLRCLSSNDLQQNINEICAEIFHKIINNLTTNENRFSTYPIHPKCLFIDFSSAELRDMEYSIPMEYFDKKSVDLANESIIAFPENKEAIDVKLSIDLTNISEYQLNNLVLIKPFNFYIAVNKHHSITASVISKIGKTYCSSFVDYTQFLKDFDFDGEYFCNNKGKRLCLPFLKEFGELFLVGKILVDKK